MSTSESIRKAVETFSRDNPGVSKVEHAFAAWYIHSKQRVAPQEALSNTSDGNYDGGIDGFFLKTAKSSEETLTLIQAKYSEDPAYVRRGLEDLAKGVSTLEQMLITTDSGMAAENRVIRSLRRTLGQLSDEQSKGLQIRCLLLHLIRDQEAWSASTATIRAKQEFNRAVGKTTMAGRVSLVVEGPAQIDSSDIVPAPAGPIPIFFEGASHTFEDGDKVLLGLGKLDDLVQLHERYRMDLFSKNVRMFLSRQANKPQSAAYNIRLALQEICDGDRSPSHFSLVHNGVTLTVPQIESPTNGALVLEPRQSGVFVLNGCQTVYTAWEFFKNASARRKDDEWKDRWRQIQIPVRLVVTESSDRVRDVSIGSNRQTSIPPAALWAHEETQLSLESKFEKVGVFYERQEGAWEQLERSGSKRVEGYPNGVAYMVDLAQTIAAADRNVSLTLARSPQRIFETKENYARVFSEWHLSSARFLVFLTNLFQASRLALKDVRESAKQKFEGLTPSSFALPVFRLMAHWIVKRERQLVLENCRTLTYSPGAWDPLRKSVFRLMGPDHTGLRQHLHSYWFRNEEWQDPCDAEALRYVFGRLHVDNVRLFEGRELLDSEDH